MAIQFPNFLDAQTRAPDYSGIGDAISNYYQGKTMPNEALISKIKAQFAQPNAEASLKTSQLGNKKSQLDIDKLSMELEQQRAFQKLLQQSLSGSGSASPSPQVPVNPLQQAMTPNIHQPVAGFIPAKDAIARANADSANVNPQTGLPMTMQSKPQDQSGSLTTQQTPSNASSAPDAMNEVVISKGAPHLAGVDAMYDNNPLSRSFLEKQGLKKSQVVKFDNKTGKTSIITTYPSGKVTIQSTSAPPPSGEGIPLTNSMITQHQKIISAIDNAKPIIQDIIDQKGFQPYPRGLGMGLVPGWIGQGATYDTLIKSAVDTLMKAYGMANTNEGIGTVKDQLLIHHGETADHYRDRLKMVLKDLDRRKQYSSNEVKRSNKIQPVDASVQGGQDNQYSPDEWEQI